MGIRSNFAWLFRGAVVTAVALTVTAAAAADYPTKKKAPPAPAPAVVAPVTPGFFVKAGFLYAINESSSKLYAARAVPELHCRPQRDDRQCRNARLRGRLLRRAGLVDRRVGRLSGVDGPPRLRA